MQGVSEERPPSSPRSDWTTPLAFHTLLVLPDEAVITTRFQRKSLVFSSFPTGLSPETQVLMKSNKMKMGKLLQSYEHLCRATPH